MIVAVSLGWYLAIGFLQLDQANETRDALEHSLAVLSEQASADDYRRARMDEVPFNGREDGEDELAAIDASMKQVSARTSCNRASI